MSTLRRPVAFVRSGFTLIEVMVAAAIMAILAAVTMPALLGTLQQKKVDATATILQNVRDAIYNTSSGAIAFEQKVGMNPGALSQLTNAISTSDRNSCNNRFGSSQVTSWNSSGPFLSYVITEGTGLYTPLGMLSDDINRSGTTITLTLPGVDTVAIDMLDAELDGADGKNAGTVQWTQPASSETTTVNYKITTKNTC